MQHVLYGSVEEMLAPETLSELAGQPVYSVHWPPRQFKGVSGSQLLCVETNEGQGPRYVLKRASLARDWIMRLTEDHRCRSVALWQHGVLDRVDHAIDHAIVTCARDGDGWAILMDDVSDALLPEPAVSRWGCERVLDALVALHSAFWDAPLLEDPMLGLCDPAHLLTCLSPEQICREREAHPILSDILRGWELLSSMVAADVVEVVRSLHRDPGPLCRALARYPQTLVHGDANAGNLGLRRNGRAHVVLLDWQFATVSSPALDLAQLFETLPALAKEPAIEQYQRRLARQLGDRYDASWWEPQLGLGLLAFFVFKGGAIPMFIERWSATEGERALQRANLAWFAEQVRAAVKWL